MSRSRKKNPAIKDGGQSHRYWKKLSSSRTRAATRNIISRIHTNSISHVDNHILLFPTQKSRELINQYNICDRIDRLDILTERDEGHWNGVHWSEYTKRDILKYYRK